MCPPAHRGACKKKSSSWREFTEVEASAGEGGDHDTAEDLMDDQLSVLEFFLLCLFFFLLGAFAFCAPPRPCFSFLLFPSCFLSLSLSLHSSSLACFPIPIIFLELGRGGGGGKAADRGYDAP